MPEHIPTKDEKMALALAQLLIAARGAVAALSQSKQYRGDIETAKRWLNDAIANAEAI